MNPDRNKLYARIENGTITEYPVPILKITSADLIAGRIKEVINNALPPNALNYQTVTSKVELVRGQPTIVHKLILKTDRAFVQEYYIAPLTPYLGKFRLDIDNVPKEVFDEMVNAVRDFGTMKLDRFAQTRGYDNIVSLVSYRGDPDPTFSRESEIGFNKRSQFWATLSAFRNKLVAGEIEFPRSAEAILEMVPDLTWE